MPRQTQTAGRTRIAFIDGLKGLCALWLCLFHYLLAFAGFGYTGWGSGIPPEAQAATYFQYFPYSVLTNSSFPLHVFFALIAFLPALRFFQNNKVESVRRQAVIRYFRLMPPVLVCSLLGWAIFACGITFNQEIGALLGNNWDKAFYPSHLTLWGAVGNGLFGALWRGDSDYCSVLWCMNIILFGSYLSYGILLFFGQLQRRVLFYAAFFLLTFTAPVYTAFIGGIAAADLLVHAGKGGRGGERRGLLLVLAGVVAGNFPPVLLPPGLTELTLYGVGAFLLLLGCGRSTWLQGLLARPWLVRVGEFSFALILTHFAVVMSFSAWFFLTMHGRGLSYAWALGLTLLTAIPVNGLFTLLFQRWVERPTERFAHWVYRQVD